MLQADNISKKLVSLKGIPFSFIISARIRTLEAWFPLLNAFIKAEHATGSSSMLFVSISLNNAQAFSHVSGMKIKFQEFRIKQFLFLVYQIRSMN